MAAKTYSQETLETFHNVRIGGPKEKRLRRVELMGEHKPKEIYYIKIVQPENAELLTCEELHETFKDIGFIGDVYRPITEKSGVIQNFAFVGFYNETDVSRALELTETEIFGRVCEVKVAPSWLLDLYPGRQPGHMHDGAERPPALTIR